MTACMPQGSDLITAACELHRQVLKHCAQDLLSLAGRQCGALPDIGGMSVCPAHMIYSWVLLLQAAVTAVLRIKAIRAS